MMNTARTHLICALLAAMVLAGPSAAADAAPRARALWLWDPAPLLEDAAARSGFFLFCRTRGITVVWMQIELAGQGPDAQLAHAGEWRALLTEAHRAGLRIHALDGSPQYALRANHAIMLGLAGAVIGFNTAGRAEQRFDGIHLDNEPYLLLAWRDRSRREQVLQEFLELNAALQARARAAGLEYGIDIPFWWQAIDDAPRAPIGVVTFRGIRKAASYHCLDLVDNVGIMDYRNTAQGPDGLIAHAAPLLEYADRVRHATLYVGVETSTADNATYHFMAGIPRRRFLDSVASASPALAPFERADVRVVEAGDFVAAGVRVSSGDARVADRLQQLARAFDVKPDRGEAAEAARRALAADPEWRDVQLAPLSDGESGRVLPGVRATRVMLPKLTFAGRSDADMERELASAEAAFTRYSSYAGIAIHHYESYRRRFDVPVP